MPTGLTHRRRRGYGGTNEWKRLNPFPILRRPPKLPSEGKVILSCVAGETDQDRGEGRAPFPADRFPDGGGGGAERVVPGHFTGDWMPETACWGKRINEKWKELHENIPQQGRSVFASGSRGWFGSENRLQAGWFHRKTRFWHWEWLANPGGGKIITRNGNKQLICAMNNKSNGKSRFRMTRQCILVFVVLISSCGPVFSHTTNPFFQFIQDQGERRYSNVPHEVLAFYYGWFGNPRNPAWGKVDAAKHEIDNVARFPAKGAYSSHDPAVVEWQIDQAKAGGITGFVVSWWGLSDWDKWHDDSLAMLLKCAEQKDFKVSIYWERAPGDGQGQIDGAINDISYVLKKYGKSKAFLKVEGKPVIFAYNRVTLFTMPVSSWPAIVQAIRKRAGDFVLLGDDQQSRGAYLFDGIHSYGANLPDDLSKQLTAGKLGELHAWLANYYTNGVSIARQRDRISCLMVSPGFDARKAYKWDTQTDRLDGQTYRTFWEEAIKANPDWIIITSWNEWGEGTEIEPSLELGDKYLQITAEYAMRFLGSPVVSAPEPARLPRFVPGRTNDLATILLNRKVGVLAQDQMDTEFWLAYCGAAIQPLDWKDLIDPNVFNARDLPLFFIHIGSEHYFSSIKVTDDVTRSLVRYMHEGGFLVSLPYNAPWPLHYDDSRKGAPPVCITDNLGLGVDNGFEDPPAGTSLKFYVNKSVLSGLPSTAAFPADGDRRFRPANRLRLPNADYYLPLVRLWGGQTHFYGDAAVYIEHRSVPLWPGKSIYVWMRTAEAIGPDKFYPSLYEFISTKLKPIR